MSLDDLEGRPARVRQGPQAQPGLGHRHRRCREQQLWGTVLACAIATRYADRAARRWSRGEANLSPGGVQRRQAAAAIMAMNNVYYRTGTSSGRGVRTLRAGLRMNIIGNPGVRQGRLRAVVARGVRDQRLRPVPRVAREGAAQGRRRREKVQEAFRIAAVDAGGRGDPGRRGPAGWLRPGRAVGGAPPFPAFRECPGKPALPRALTCDESRVSRPGFVVLKSRVASAACPRRAYGATFRTVRRTAGDVDRRPQPLPGFAACFAVSERRDGAAR